MYRPSDFVCFVCYSIFSAIPPTWLRQCPGLHQELTKKKIAVERILGYSSDDQSESMRNLFYKLVPSVRNARLPH